jgi:uncharacterized protein (DUF433 family)
MSGTLATENIPLATDADGVMRVRGSRVTLDTLVAPFAEGATADEIAQQYTSLSLADVYQVIGYYLRHSAELEPYLAGRRQRVDEVREANEARWPAVGIRERLLARRRT